MSPAYRCAALSSYRLGLSITTHQPIEAPESAKSPAPPTKCPDQPVTPGHTYTPTQLAALKAAFTPAKQANFEDEEVFGEDNAKELLENTLANLSSTTTKSRTIEHPSRTANWLKRGFRQARLEDNQTRQLTHASRTSHKDQINKVTFNNETDIQQSRRKRWLKGQVYYEAQMQQCHPTGWYRRIPFRFQDKGCKLEHHRIHTPRKRQKRDIKDSSASPKTLAASAAAAQDEAKAAQLKQQGFKRVMVTKALYRPREKSIYMEPNYIPPEDDEDWACLHKNLGNIIHQHKQELPLRDDVTLYHEAQHKEQFDCNIQWHDTPIQLEPCIIALIKLFWDVFDQVGVSRPI
jgi:hypothetical protein